MQACTCVTFCFTNQAENWTKPEAVLAKTLCLSLPSSRSKQRSNLSFEMSIPGEGKGHGRCSVWVVYLQQVSLVDASSTSREVA